METPPESDPEIEQYMDTARLIARNHMQRQEGVNKMLSMLMKLETGEQDVS